MGQEKKRSRRRFTEEFKRDAAALVIDTGRPIAQVARELGVYESSLGRWVAQERANRGETDELTTLVVIMQRGPYERLRTTTVAWHVR